MRTATATAKATGHGEARHAAYLLGETLPEPLQPSERARRLTAALVWRGVVVELVEVPEDRAFSVGPRGASLQVVHELAGGRAIPLFRPGKHGVEVLLPDGVEATLRRGERTWTGRELAEAGEARVVEVPCRGQAVGLGLSDRLSVRFGEVLLVARYTRPEAMPVRTWRDRIDPDFLSTMAIAVFAALLVTRMFALAGTAPTDPDGDGLRGLDRYVEHFVHAAPPPPPVKRDPAPIAKARGTEGATGKPDATKKATALSKPGGGPEKLAHDKQVVQNSGLLKLLAMGGPMADVLRPGSVGMNNGLGHLVASNDLGDETGLTGFGARGHGPGGGGCPECGLRIGGLGNRPGNGPPNAHGLSLDGVGKQSTPLPPTIRDDGPGYDRDVIARIVRRHWNEIRYCYEQALSKNPNLTGKVAVHFVIGPVGEVSEVSSTDVTLDSGEAVQCMLRNVGRWQFPAPKGGGTVEVTYPFLFQAS